MISVEEALSKILNNIEILETEQRPLLETLGQVLAEDVYSNIDVPPLDNSAFDGYAVIAEDIRGASPESSCVLRVIDTVFAGSLPQKDVEPGTAVRIMTGASVPGGADAIVKFEDTDEVKRKETSGQQQPSEIGIQRELTSGANIRPAGESIAKGDLSIAKGTVIRPSEIGVLASIGRSSINVIRRPVVAILATGDEVVDITQQLPEGKIYNSNSYSVAAQVLRYGGVPKLLGIALDEEESVRAVIKQSMDADILITIGGVSMGDYDLVKDILKSHGEMIFWKVRMKPGKPLTFGLIKTNSSDGETRTIPHLGLAGNPVSCMVNFEIFGRPAMLKMMSRNNLNKPTIEAKMVDHIKNKDGRRIYARVIVEKRDNEYYASLTGHQGSGILSSMSLANGLAIVPEDRKLVNEGEKLSIIMLDWSEEL